MPSTEVLNPQTIPVKNPVSLSTQLAARITGPLDVITKKILIKRL